MDFSHRAEIYRKYRKAYERLTDYLAKKLLYSRTLRIADIGAGTGNYTLALMDKGFNVTAIEPEPKMISMSVSNSIEWVNSCAEYINLPDSCVNGAVAINSIHHFNNLEKSFKEIFRNCA